MASLVKSFRLSACLRGAPVLGAAQVQTCQSYVSFSTSRPAAITMDARRSALRKDHQAADEARQMEKNLTREWKAGDVYAPHDLSAAEMRKWRKRVTPTTDAFDALSLNPLELYKNFSVMSEYMTEMGRIRHRKTTGLRAVNQRKIAKAIRRAVALGLMPSVHRHPELLKLEMDQTASNYGPPR